MHIVIALSAISLVAFTLQSVFAQVPLGNQAQSTAVTTLRSSGLPDDDATYRAGTKRWLLENLYPNKKEEAIYQDIRKRDMHYLYVGFLEAFPSNPHRQEVLELLQGFALYETDKAVTYSFQEMETQFNFDRVDTVFRWGDAFAGMEVVAPGENRWFGPICLGNIQFLTGGFVSKKQAAHLNPGTRIIYRSRRGLDAGDVASSPKK